MNLEGKTARWKGKNGEVVGVIARDAEGNLYVCTDTKTGKGVPLRFFRACPSFKIDD